MKKQRFTVLFAILIVSVFLTGCGIERHSIEETEESLQGGWYYEDSDHSELYVFREGNFGRLVDINGSESESYGTYEIERDQINTIIVQSDGSEIEGHLPYSYKDGELVLTTVNGDAILKLPDENE